MKLSNAQVYSLRKIIYEHFKSQPDVEIGDLQNCIEEADYIVREWIMKEGIEVISDETSNKHCNDVDGNILQNGDDVVVLDCEDLEDCDLVRGDIVKVTSVYDTTTNYVNFIKGHMEYGFYGHRVLKLKNQ
jgi:uncharacterized Zn ribbon protein